VTVQWRAASQFSKLDHCQFPTNPKQVVITVVVVVVIIIVVVVIAVGLFPLQGFKLFFPSFVDIFCSSVYVDRTA
jgi:hypothetical protein